MRTGSHTAPLEGERFGCPDGRAGRPHCIAISSPAQSSKPTSQGYCSGTFPLEGPYKHVGDGRSSPGPLAPERLLRTTGWSPQQEGEGHLEKPLQRGLEKSEVLEELPGCLGGGVPGRPRGHDQHLAALPPWRKAKRVYNLFLLASLTNGVTHRARNSRGERTHEAAAWKTNSMSPGFGVLVRCQLPALFPSPEEVDLGVHAPTLLTRATLPLIS